MLGIAPMSIFSKKKIKQNIEISVEPSAIPISLKGVYHYQSGSTKTRFSMVHRCISSLCEKMGKTWDDVERIPLF